MSKNWQSFPRGSELPSFYMNALAEFISTQVSNFRLTLLNSTTIQVVAGTVDDLVAIGIDGQWRYNTATVTRNVSGTAGAYDVFVTAAATSVSNSPQVFTDNTNYSFALSVVAAGGSPTIVPGSVDIHRKVGNLVWSGTAITALFQTVGGAGAAAHATTHETTGQDPIASLPTAGQKQALAGSSGTPGSGNLYVTAADARLPTTDENNALQGTDGSPSNSNRYVTSTDTRVARSFISVGPLPASPVDGQEVDVLVDAALGTTWRFRYRAASSGSYKWHFVGGSALQGEVETNTTITGNYGTSPTSPALVIAFPGDYLVRYGATVSTNDWTTSRIGLHVSASLVDEIPHSHVNAGVGSSQEIAIGRTKRVTSASANFSVDLRYATSLGAPGTCDVSNRWVEATPIRVSA